MINSRTIASRLPVWARAILPTPPLGQCVLCGASAGASDGLCLDCLSDLPWPQLPCARCAEELKPDSDSSWCERCLLTPPAFDNCIALLRYQFPARELIASFKFRAGFAVGRSLGILLAERLLSAAADSLPEMLLPVPLHQQRLRHRGFNQSTLLAQAVSSRSGIPVVNCASRVRATTIQRTLRAEARLDNLKEAFVVDPVQLRHVQHVVIVDDVVTTMNTVNSLTIALRKAGVVRIDVLCAARVS